MKKEKKKSFNEMVKGDNVTLSENAVSESAVSENGENASVIEANDSGFEMDEAVIKPRLGNNDAPIANDTEEYRSGVKRRRVGSVRERVMSYKRN